MPKWLIEFAENSNPKLQMILANLFEGVAFKNEEEAMKWYQKAAELGYEPAIDKLKGS